MVTQVQVQEATERLRKTTCIIPAGARDPRHIPQGHMGDAGWSEGAGAGEARGLFLFGDGRARIPPTRGLLLLKRSPVQE